MESRDGWIKGNSSQSCPGHDGYGTLHIDLRAENKEQELMYRKDNQTRGPDAAVQRKVVEAKVTPHSVVSTGRFSHLSLLSVFRCLIIDCVKARECFHVVNS